MFLNKLYSLLISVDGREKIQLFIFSFQSTLTELVKFGVLDKVRVYLEILTKRMLSLFHLLSFLIIALFIILVVFYFRNDYWYK